MGGIKSVNDGISVLNYTNTDSGKNTTLIMYDINGKINDKLSLGLSGGVGSGYEKQNELFAAIDLKATYKFNDNLKLGFRSRNYGANSINGKDNFSQSANRFTLTGTVPINDNTSIYATAANTTKFNRKGTDNYSAIYLGAEHNWGNNAIFCELDKTIKGDLNFNIGYSYKF